MACQPVGLTELRKHGSTDRRIYGGTDLRTYGTEVDVV